MASDDLESKEVAVTSNDRASTKSRTETDAVPMEELHIDPKDERRVLTKLDIFITPVLFIVYLSCFIDRANIGKEFLLRLHSSHDTLFC